MRTNLRRNVKELFLLLQFLLFLQLAYFWGLRGSYLAFRELEGMELVLGLRLEGLW